MIIENESIIDLLKKMNHPHIDDKEDGYYYCAHKVPRVTAILKEMIHEEYISQWANSLGFKRISYSAALREASEKGTYTHKAIEEYLKKKEYPNYDKIPFPAKDATRNAFEGFLNWYLQVEKNNRIRLVFSEKKLVCKYFGGTLDCLISINDKLWLIDFKTSNHMNYKYFLQLSAYTYMLREVEGIEVGGCLVLLLDKQSPKFSEYVLDFSNDEHKKFIEECEETFMSLVYSFYNKRKIQSEYKRLF